MLPLYILLRDRYKYKQATIVRFRLVFTSGITRINYSDGFMSFIKVAYEDLSAKRCTAVFYLKSDTLAWLMDRVLILARDLRDE